MEIQEATFESVWIGVGAINCASHKCSASVKVCAGEDIDEVASCSVADAACMIRSGGKAELELELVLWLLGCCISAWHEREAIHSSNIYISTTPSGPVHGIAADFFESAGCKG